MNLIQCRGLTRHYRRTGVEPVRAVDGIDLDVGSASFVAIVGPSGSGKTTLLGLLAGLEPADHGEVRVLGHDLARLSSTERARIRQRRLGIVFQSFGLIPSLRVGENVALPLLLGGVAPSDAERRVRRVLEEVGLGTTATSRIDELSGGERQRVGVARALVIEPALILADEPTGSLDEDNARGVLRLLVDAVRRRTASLLLVTHDAASAGLADRCLRMRDGHLTEGAQA